MAIGATAGSCAHRKGYGGDEGGRYLLALLSGMWPAPLPGAVLATERRTGLEGRGAYAAPPRPGEGRGAERIVYEDTVSPVAEFWVDLTGGVQTTFETTALSTGGDPVLHLLDSSGNEVAVDDNNGAGANATLAYRPSVNATYRVDVHAARASSGGTVTLLKNGSPWQTPVRAYANMRRGGQCEHTRWNERQVGTSAGVTLGPAVGRLQDGAARRLYVFYIRDGRLKYTYSTDSWDCPRIDEGCTGSWSPEGDAGAGLHDSELLGVDATRIRVPTETVPFAKEQLLVVTTDQSGALLERRLEVSDQQETWTGPAIIQTNDIQVTGEPSLARVDGDTAAYLAYKGIDRHVRIDRLVAGGGWDGPRLALTPGEQQILLHEQASPAVIQTHLPWRPEKGLYGAFIDERGYLDMWWLNLTSGRWEKTDVLDAPSGRLAGRPAMAWVQDGPTEPLGRFYMVVTEPFGPRVSMFISYVDAELVKRPGRFGEFPWQLVKTPRVGMKASFDNSWFQAGGVALLHEPGVDANLRAIYTNLTPGDALNRVMLRPNADGIIDFAYTNYNDWETPRWGVCAGVVDPGGTVTNPIVCP